MTLGAFLRRDSAIVAGGLAGVVVLAWYYIWQGAGMGMSALDMTVLSLFPHRQAGMEGSMDASWLVVAGMWSVMMVAMMTPSASPLVLLYVRVLRQHAAPLRCVIGLSAVLLAGYLSAWLVFSLAAASLQKLLEPSGLISQMMLWSRSAILSAALLALAGIYQISALKHACLAQCRAPARFLVDHWRPGPGGSFSLGLRHGAFCVGCCWALMGLLFVGGIMNLTWIAALAAVALLERLLPPGNLLDRAAGALLLIWAGATLVV